MAMPDDLNPIAARIYEEILPVAYDDAAYGYFLAHMVEAWTRPFLIIEEIARDTEDGPGWSVIFNPEEAPAIFLDWLSACVGSIPRAGETEAQARIRIAGMQDLRRGSTEAMRAAATRYLVPTVPGEDPYVIFNERAGDNAWHLEIRTLDSETPEPDKVLQALLEQKPVGIVMGYDAVPGATYDTLFAAYDTYDDVLDAYESYGHVVTDLPA